MTHTVRARLLTLAAFAVTLSGVNTSAFGQEADPIVEVRVEWEIKILTPDPVTSSPQFITVLSEDATVNNRHSVFEVNHSTAPSYTKGGYQRQNWLNEGITAWQGAAQVNKPLATQGELVEFIHRMYFSTSTNPDTGVTTRYLMFGVSSLNSTTWGNQSSMGATGHVTTLTDLSGFDIDTCLRESGITKGANRVEFMRIDNIDYVHASGAIVNDSTDRYVQTVSTTTSAGTQLTPTQVDQQTAY